MMRIADGVIFSAVYLLVAVVDALLTTVGVGGHLAPSSSLIIASMFTILFAIREPRNDKQ